MPTYPFHLQIMLHVDLSSNLRHALDIQWAEVPYLLSFTVVFHTLRLLGMCSLCHISRIPWTYNVIIIAAIPSPCGPKYIATCVFIMGTYHILLPHRREALWPFKRSTRTATSRAEGCSIVGSTCTGRGRSLKENAITSSCGWEHHRFATTCVRCVTSRPGWWKRRDVGRGSQRMSLMNLVLLCEWTRINIIYTCPCIV